MKTKLARFVPFLAAIAIMFALLPACQKKKAPEPVNPGEPAVVSSADSDSSSESAGEGEGEGDASGVSADDLEGEGGQGAEADSGGSGSASLTGSFVIRGGVGLYAKSGDVMKWKDSLGIGQPLTVSGGAVKSKVEKDTYEYSFLPVTLESGADGYVIEQYVAVDATLGAVTSDLATLYKQAKETAVLATIVPVMNIVATFPVEGKPDFYRILGYDAASGDRYADRFMAASDVSIRGDDVNAALLMSAIKSVSKKEQKRKLLSTIQNKYPASAFSGKVQELQIALEPSKMGTSPLSGEYVAGQDGTIRDIPSVFGASVKKLAKGDPVTVVEATSEKFTIGEDTAPWIRVSKPAEGWVFGSVVSEKR